MTTTNVKRLTGTEARSTTHRPAVVGRRMATVVGALLVAASGIAIGAAAPATADNATFVAIAFSSDNGAHGWANNRTAEPDAARSAQNYCQQYGGNRCFTAAIARNQCAAIAVMTPAVSVDHKWGAPHAGFGPDIATANAAASAANGGGEVIVARCAAGSQGWG